jgi:hypothetical protein
VDPSRRTRRALLLVVPTVCIALAASGVSFSSRGDVAFVYDQQHPRAVGVQELEVLLQKARQPTPSGPGAPAVGASCRPGSNSPQRNPWTCTVRYASRTSIRYRVIVRTDGSYVGGDPRHGFYVNGCCVSGGTSAPG